MTHSEPDLSGEVARYLEAYPDTRSFEVFVVDANGIQRGKRLPVAMMEHVAQEGIHLQRSVFSADVWSEDIVETGLIFETGDADTVCHIVPGSVQPVPWLDQRTAQALLWMEGEDGQPFFGDPRQVLVAMQERFAALGLTPVVATEIEFFLLDANRRADQAPQPPRSPRTGQSLAACTHMYGITELHELDEFFREVEQACRLQGLPTETLIAEHGRAQYEINLLHVADAVVAADYTVMLKRIIKGVAARHGMEATFMAKPHELESGSGFHVHMSLLNAAGENVFGAGEDGEQRLRHAIGGVLQSMADTMAILAPNRNSYRRFQPGSYAPMAPVWGYDNRTLAVRVPKSSAGARRLEHRVAGADANPYLTVAAVLSGVIAGLEGRIDPGAPIAGNAYDHDLERLPVAWGPALERFEQSAHVAHYFGPAYQQLYATCKRQEYNVFNQRITALEYESYLRSV